MALVAGVDSSTQSTKVVVCDADTGEVLREGRAAHPDGTEVDPHLWWAAFERASAGLLDGVVAIGVGGQQQGMICLDEAGEVVRPALLWNDTRSARAAVDLTDEFGGPQAWADAVGLVPVASFTVTKLRWFARAEPELAARTRTVLLPHDWLTHRLRAGGGEPTTDRGEASGTGYWSPATGEYRRDLVRLAFGRDVALPRVAGPAETVGETASGAILAAGTGDTMGAALGVGLRSGDVVVSLGTSGCAFGLSEVPTADPSRLVAGYADATGRFLPLVCTLNAARVLVAVADLLGRSLAELDDLALSASPGAGGLTLLPYLDGERTPNLPDARGLLAGLTRTNASAANLARAAVACGPRAFRWTGCYWSVARPGHARCGRSRRHCSARRWACRAPASTSRSARRVRRPGRCPVRPNRHSGRSWPRRSPPPAPWRCTSATSTSANGRSGC